MDDLVARLRACLDTDERVALAAGGDYGAEWEAVNEPAGSAGFEIKLAGEDDLFVDCSREAPATHIARFDPERARRWVKAAREILDRHVPARWDSNREYCPRCTSFAPTPEWWPCPDVRALMSVYGDTEEAG